jgi:hypothetical protein
MEICEGLKAADEGKLTALEFPTRNLTPHAPEAHFSFHQDSQRQLSTVERREFRLQVFRDYMLLHDLLPDGVWLCGYDNRYVRLVFGTCKLVFSI